VWRPVLQFRRPGCGFGEVHVNDDFVQGQKAGDYEVLGVLGAGGMGKSIKSAT
jgi:hypothetical protein